MNNKKYDIEKLIDEIGFLDDDIIASAALSKKVKRRLSWKKISSIAACFILVLSGVYFGIKSFVGNEFDSSGVLGEETNENSKISDVSDKVYENNVDKENVNPEFSKSDFIDDYTETESEDRNNNVPVNSDEAGNIYGSSIVDTEEDAFLSKEKEESNEDINLSSEEKCEEEMVSSDESDEIVDDQYHSNNFINLSEKVEIDNLNKLAYYSGWTMIRKYGNINLFSAFYDETRPLKATVVYENHGWDVSIEEVFISSDMYLETDSTVVEWETSEEYSGLIPIDPGFEGEVIAYAVYKLTVNSAEYFQAVINNGGFLAEQIGEGNVEIMILDVEFDGVEKDTMIVFKNGERYFSCLLDTYTSTENGGKHYRFSAGKYVSNFSIVKMPEFNDYNFTVEFVYNDNNISEIIFAEYSDDAEFVTNQISIDTYNFANNVSVSNTAFGLNEELYKIYLEDVAAGVKPPVLPEKPILPDTSETSEPPMDFHIESSFVGLFEGEGGWGEDPNFSEYGHEVVSLGSEKLLYLKEMFPNDDFCQFVEDISGDVSYLVVWVKGKARHSYSEWQIDEVGNLIFNFDYVLFKNSDDYTVFLFELIAPQSIEKVILNMVDYSTTLTATFTTDNEYDYIDIHNKTDEDEYIINLFSTALYRIYKNEILIYEGEYKVSSGYVCLCVPDDTLYLELSPEATFVYQLEGRNRIFKLI